MLVPAHPWGEASMDIDSCDFPDLGGSGVFEHLRAFRDLRFRRSGGAGCAGGPRPWDWGIPGTRRWHRGRNYDRSFAERTLHKRPGVGPRARAAEGMGAVQDYPCLGRSPRLTRQHYRERRLMQGLENITTLPSPNLRTKLEAGMRDGKRLGPGSEPDRRQDAGLGRGRQGPHSPCRTR